LPNQYWEVWFADGRVVTSDDCAPAALPRERVVIILQPGAHERTGWKDQLLTVNHVFFRTDLDCWTEHDPDLMWCCLEFQDHAHVISCYRMGKWVGDFQNIRKRADLRYKELTSGG